MGAPNSPPIGSPPELPMPVPGPPSSVPQSNDSNAHLAPPPMEEQYNYTSYHHDTHSPQYHYSSQQNEYFPPPPQQQHYQQQPYSPSPQQQYNHYQPPVQHNLQQQQQNPYPPPQQQYPYPPPPKQQNSTIPTYSPSQSAVEIGHGASPDPSVSHQGGIVPTGVPVPGSHMGMTLVPAKQQNGEKVALYFVLGLVLALFLDVFAFLFLCCHEAIGLEGKRKPSFLCGTVTGCLINIAAFVVLYVYLF